MTTPTAALVEQALIKDALELCGTLEAGYKHRLLSELAHALRRTIVEREEAKRDAEAYKRQTQEVSAKAIELTKEVCAKLEKAEAERDAQHALVLRLTGEREEAKADAVRMLTAASQRAITNARLAADLDEARVVHACPPKGSGVMPCCGATAFERPGDRLTTNAALVTCNQRRRVAELTATRDLLTAENARLQKEVATLRYLHNGGH